MARMNCPTLQFGRDLTIAETRPGGRLRHLPPASIRPRSDDRGDLVAELKGTSGNSASIRPRSDDRGDSERAGARGAPAVASIRPRSDDRGDDTTAPSSPSGMRLQFGRDLT